MKPSRRAALASRSSRVTMFSEAGNPSEAMTAAASCSESAPRSGCTRRSRRATPRRAAVGCTSFQLSARRSRRSSAVVIAPSVNAPSRSSLDRADAHSTSVAHHTHITGSCAALASSPFVLASVTISGTIAELSQNLNGRRASPRSAPQRRLLQPAGSAGSYSAAPSRAACEPPEPLRRAPAERSFPRHQEKH
jgi:hypothetical protein